MVVVQLLLRLAAPVSTAAVAADSVRRGSGSRGFAVEGSRPTGSGPVESGVLGPLYVKCACVFDFVPLPL